MGIYLDSARLDDAVAVEEFGFVIGITTNPTLMRAVTTDPLGHLSDLLTSTEFTEIYYQPCGAYPSTHVEAMTAWSIAPERVVLKLPATPDGAAEAARCVREGARVALTAAQSPGALLVADAVGASAVIPYVDRAVRDAGTDSEIVRSLADVRGARRSPVILAASVKNSGQFVQAVRDGADSVSAPLDVLGDLLNHPAALAAERAFADEFRPIGPLQLSRS